MKQSLLTMLNDTEQGLIREAVRKDRSGSESRDRGKLPRGSGARARGKAAVKRGGDNRLRSPIAEKGTAATRATGKRRQAKRDSR